ncbi:MAG TPA: hypothetical protein VE219_04635 [Candidatus Sulfotelmatobacter sp.]|nr:hypothetical protein [Candidatus Sulfotelmatobacter sp.]
MPEIVISFADGEVLHAVTPDITFDRPLLEAEVRNVDPNSDRALFALTAIRQMVVGEIEAAPDESTLSSWDRAAFHFLDGHVLRAWISPDSTLGRFGGVWRTVEPDSDELRTLAIPYTSLKGVFRLKQWDGRLSRQRAQEGDAARLDQLARVLAERATETVSDAPTRRPLMERVRRGR